MGLGYEVVSAGSGFWWVWVMWWCLLVLGSGGSGLCGGVCWFWVLVCLGYEVVSVGSGFWWVWSYYIFCLFEHLIIFDIHYDSIT